MLDSISIVKYNSTLMIFIHRYSPNFDTWMQMASMNEERATFCAMSVGHHVIAVGGRNRFGSLSTAEKVGKNDVFSRHDTICTCHCIGQSVCSKCFFVRP